MTRDELVKNIERIFGSTDDFLDLIEYNIPYSFEYLTSDGPSSEIYIIDTVNNRYIHWYKLTHIGRDFSTDMKTDDEIISFLEHLLYESVTMEE